MDIEVIEEPDVIFAILNTALGWWPEDGEAGAAQSAWIFEQFDRVDGDALYGRYLRLCDGINGTDIASHLDF